MVHLRLGKWQTVNKQFILTLFIGITAGFLVAYVLLTPQDAIRRIDFHTSHEMAHLAGPTMDPGDHSMEEEFHQMEDREVANRMYNKVRILCWVMTGPKNHEKRAKHVKNTWGKRCNIILFMSSKEDPTLPAVALPVGEGRDNLWAKTKEAFKYVYNNYKDKADWFMKADDDTYVILENLRYMLLPYKSSEPIYFGCKFKPYVKQGYMSGGAGYVLSREALNRFVEAGLNNATGCSKKNSGAEDVEMGKCMEALDVVAGDSRDPMGRGRFFPFVPEHHLIPGHVNKDFWYWQYIYYESKEGMNCCSDNAVSFHYVSPNQMYVLEYLIYHLRPYGISFHVDMPQELQDTVLGTLNKTSNRRIAAVYNLQRAICQEHLASLTFECDLIRQKDERHTHRSKYSALEGETRKMLLADGALYVVYCSGPSERQQVSRELSAVYPS